MRGCAVRPPTTIHNSSAERSTIHVRQCHSFPEVFLEVKEHEANEQHKSIIEALKAAASEWTFEQINFVEGRRGAVVEDNFYNKLERLSVQAGKRDDIPPKNGVTPKLPIEVAQCL